MRATTGSPAFLFLSMRSFISGRLGKPGSGLAIAHGLHPSCDLLGRALEQPRVLLPDGHSTATLDDLLGRGYAILGVDVDGSAWAQVRDSPLSGLGAAELNILTGDRLPRANGEPPGVADVDGRLHRLFGSVRGHFVVVRPDRYVCAVLTARQATSVGWEIERLLGNC